MEFLLPVLSGNGVPNGDVKHSKCCLETFPPGHSVPRRCKCKGKFVSVHTFCYFHVLFSSRLLL